MQGAVQAFLVYLSQEQGCSSHTITAYRSDLGQFLDRLARQGLTSPQQVTREHIADFYRWLEASDWAVSTVARKMAAVRSFFRYLVREGVLRDDPSAGMSPPRVPRQRPRTLSEQDLARLLGSVQAVTTPKARRDRALLELLRGTGMRASEVIALQVSDLDLEQGLVRCRGGRSGQRWLPLNSEAVEALRAYLQEGRPVLVEGQSEHSLFVNLRGQSLTRQGLWLIVSERAREAGIRREVSPYVLRHSCAVRLLEEGASLQEVQSRLGHVNLATTQVYVLNR